MTSELHLKLAILYLKIPDTEHLPKSAELAKSVSLHYHSAIKKEPLLWFFFNGGNDEARFELIMVRYFKHILTPEVVKICSTIEKLSVFA